MQLFVFVCAAFKLACIIVTNAPDPPPLAADGVESEWEARCSRFLSRCHGIDFSWLQAACL